jgi:hypothetical protein
MKPRAIILGLLVWAAATAPAFAQADYPPVEVFGGFSVLPADGDDFPRQTSFGFQASIRGNLSRWFGIVGDFGGQYRTASNLGPNFPGVVAKTSVYQYLAGPSFTVRRERVGGFVHGLVGGARGRSSLEGFSDSAFALGGGGGVDVRLTERSAFRAQIDYVGSFVDILENNIRIGFGVTISVGGS